jgi:hypothetical protein
MPQAVKFDPPDARFGQDPGVFLVSETVHRQWVAERVPMPLKMLPFLGKNESMVVILGPICELKFRLMGFMRVEQHYGLGSNRDGPTLPIFERQLVCHTPVISFSGHTIKKGNNGGHLMICVVTMRQNLRIG